jgi:hypothetical protein
MNACECKFPFVLVLTSLDPTDPAKFENAVMTSASRGELFGCNEHFNVHQTSAIVHGQLKPSYAACELKGRIGETEQTDQQEGRTVAQNILDLMKRLATVLRARCYLQSLPGVDSADKLQRLHQESMRASLVATSSAAFPMPMIASPTPVNSDR